MAIKRTAPQFRDERTFVHDQGWRKTSAVITVGTATIAAFIGAGGLGERIVTGLALNDNVTLLAGAIPVAVLAILIEQMFGFFERKLTPPALRQ